MTKNWEPFVPGQVSAHVRATAIPVSITWSSIGHAEQERLVVLQLEVLIFEFLAVDALSTRAVPSSEIATLDHERLNHSMKARSLVVEGLAHLAHTLFAGA